MVRDHVINMYDLYISKTIQLWLQITIDQAVITIKSYYTYNG